MIFRKKKSYKQKFYELANERFTELAKREKYHAERFMKAISIIGDEELREKIRKYWYNL